MDDKTAEYKCVAKQLTQSFASYYTWYIYLSINKATLY